MQCDDNGVLFVFTRCVTCKYIAVMHNVISILSIVTYVIELHNCILKLQSLGGKSTNVKGVVFCARKE